MALLALAVATGGLAAAQARERALEVEARVGPLVPVVVARTDVASGTRVTQEAAGRLLAVRDVPERFRPPDALGSPGEATGLRVGAAIPAGGYVTASALAQAVTPRASTPAIATGERLIDLDVAGGRSLTGQTAAGARVDVLVTSEPRSGPGRTWVALERVELVALAPAAAVAGGEAGASTSDARATLRVSPRQAVFLTAATAFAREVRLLARAAGDERPVGPASIWDEDL
jgi:pilus assembly protein CpaB